MEKRSLRKIILIIPIVSILIISCTWKSPTNLKSHCVFVFPKLSSIPVYTTNDTVDSVCFGELTGDSVVLDSKVYYPFKLEFKDKRLSLSCFSGREVYVSYQEKVILLAVTRKGSKRSGLFRDPYIEDTLVNLQRPSRQCDLKNTMGTYACNLIFEKGYTVLQFYNRMSPWMTFKIYFKNKAVEKFIFADLDLNSRYL